MKNQLSFKTIGLLFMISFLFSCKKDDPQSVDLIVNGNVETGTGGNAQGWTFLTLNGSIYQTGAMVSNEHVSGSHSLSVSSSSIDTLAESYDYFYQEISNFPKDTKLTLKVKVKGVNVNGNGFNSIEIYALGQDNAGKTTVSANTLSDASMTGTFEWKEMTLDVNSIPSNTEKFGVFLGVSPFATGTVYFDDISLTYLKK